MGTEELLEGFDTHLRSLRGRRLTFLGGSRAPFEVLDASGDQVRVSARGQRIVLPKQWFNDAWRTLVTRRSLVRADMRSTTARYRDGYIFAILASHPLVEVARAFPTRLVLKHVAEDPTPVPE